MEDSNKRSPIDDLVAALSSDHEYRYGWQSNLAGMMIDNGVDPLAANRAASQFLNRICADDYKVIARVDIGESIIPPGLVDRLEAEDPLGLGSPDGFKAKLRDLLNCASMENGSDTPDFILARYLAECLEVFDRAVSARTAELKSVDIVFDGPPGPEGPRFIEVENMEGKSIRVGGWVERDDGHWALRLTVAGD